MNNQDKTVVVVLGMHRGGTSVVARALQVMGVQLGDNLMPPFKEDNPKGYWEDLDVHALNLEILKYLHADWHTLAPFQPEEFANLLESDYFRKAVAMLTRKTAGTPVFGLKDPRLARLLPFWRQVFERCGLTVRYVLTVRHPLSVCRSLARRDGFPYERSSLIWTGHILGSLTGSRGEKTVVVDYDRLLVSPQRELSRLADRLGLRIDQVEYERFEGEFIDPGLRHTQFTPQDLAADKTIVPLARELYLALLDAAADQVDPDERVMQARIEVWQAEFDRLAPVLSLVDSLNSKIRKTHPDLHSGTLSIRRRLFARLAPFLVVLKKKRP